MRSKTSKNADRKSKRPQPKPPPPPPAKPAVFDHSRLGPVVLWLVQGHLLENVTEAIRAKWPDENPALLIDAAHAQLAKAADFNPALLRGWCLEAYRELHRRLIEMGDYPAAGRIVAKLNAIADSAAAGPDTPAATQSDAEITRARAHLDPLFPEGPTLTLTELCRQAAAAILNKPT